MFGSWGCGVGGGVSLGRFLGAFPWGVFFSKARCTVARGKLGGDQEEKPPKTSQGPFPEYALEGETRIGV